MVWWGVLYQGTPTHPPLQTLEEVTTPTTPLFLTIIIFVAGIPTTSSLGTTTYYTTTDNPGSPVKYQENGHDTFSDFVTLVCQEAGQAAPGHAPKSPTKLVSYYSTGMFPPAPAPPMARPVPVKLPGNINNTTNCNTILYHLLVYST